jgi:hypothetical protein
MNGVMEQRVLASARKRVPDAEWTLSKVEDYPQYVLRAGLWVHSAMHVDELLLVSAERMENVWDVVTDQVARALEYAIDERSKAAAEWKTKALAYREMMRSDPRAWSPLL